MSVKDTVLRILEEKKGEMVSGQGIAREASASRTAVWKAIQSLREEGYPIDSSTSKGYQLSLSSDYLSSQGIRNHCPRLSADKIFVHKTLESTNNMARQLISEKQEMPFLVVSEAQTGGRGRMGRSFFSPGGTGIYMSLALHPNFDVSRSVMITTAASIAVCRGIREVLGLDCQIKWVNDIFYKGKKICGILTEGITSFESGLVESVVIGIGVNYRWPKDSFPEELKEVAGALLTSEEISPVPGASRNRLAGSIVHHLLSLLDQLDAREYMQEYRDRSLVLGKDIRFIQGTQRGARGQEGRVIDIDDSGGLLVRTEGGEIVTLNSGEISIRSL